MGRDGNNKSKQILGNSVQKYYSNSTSQLSRQVRLNWQIMLNVSWKYIHFQYKVSLVNYCSNKISLKYYKGRTFAPSYLLSELFIIKTARIARIRNFFNSNMHLLTIFFIMTSIRNLWHLCQLNATPHILFDFWILRRILCSFYVAYRNINSTDSTENQKRSQPR